MERLTLASLQHLPTAVLFVADLTGECGTSVADQWRIRWAWGLWGEVRDEWGTRGVLGGDGGADLTGECDTNVADQWCIRRGAGFWAAGEGL